MYTQLEDKSKALLSEVQKHPGFNARQLADVLTKTHTMVEVTSALWGLWNGRYITRTKSETKASNGMTPFAYWFKTDKPRSKKRGKVKRKYVRRVVPAVKPPMNVRSNVEILIAVKGVHETLTLTPVQVRDLYETLKALLGA